MTTHEYANGKITFVSKDQPSKPHLTFVNTDAGVTCTSFVGYNYSLREAELEHGIHAMEMWVDAAESNLIDAQADLTDVQHRNSILMENNNILFDQNALLKDENASLREENDYLREAAGVETIAPGDKVWSKATNRGPYVVLAEQAHSIYGSQKTTVESWLVRDKHGKDFDMPKAEATRRVPPQSWLFKTVSNGVLLAALSVAASASVMYMTVVHNLQLASRSTVKR